MINCELISQVCDLLNMEIKINKHILIKPEHFSCIKQLLKT